jgi:hypothetical protein
MKIKNENNNENMKIIFLSILTSAVAVHIMGFNGKPLSLM